MRLPDHMPSSMHGLPRNPAGYPIPWFVRREPGDGGNPDFRIMDPVHYRDCWQKHLCWVCGTTLTTREPTFVSGPMCLVNHTSAEPPCHYKCAVWSARACPFLAQPKRVRREGNLPGPVTIAGGFSIPRNPGVAAIIVMADRKSYRPIKAPNGVVFRFDDPLRVEWYAEGREATRSEVCESLATGLPALREVAEEDGPEAIDELARLVDEAMRLVPA